VQLRYAAPLDPSVEGPQRLLLAHDGKTPLSDLAQQAVEGKATAARCVSV
jgi:hypothetical protein